MSGKELIDWLSGECRMRKIPPTDSAMILVLREQWDIEASMRTLKHTTSVTYREGDSLEGDAL